MIVDLGVAMVPEGRRLFPRLTVLENLMLGAFRKAARPDIGRNLAFAFETFPVLKERQEPARRHAVGRAAADAGDRARADVVAAAAADR